VGLDEVTQARNDFVEQLEATQASLAEAQQSNARTVAENDGLQGQIARMETEYKESIEKLHSNAREQEKENARERARVSDERTAALARQRQELTEAAEQAENRLMVLLDKERQSAKDATAQLSSELAKVQDKAQSHREKTIALEAVVRQLTEQKGKLEVELTRKEEAFSDLWTTLQEEKKRGASVQRDFDAYREEHKIGGQLADLQATITALQEKMNGSS
jgi:chromosome segregation ATPase